MQQHGDMSTDGYTSGASGHHSVADVSGTHLGDVEMGKILDDLREQIAKKIDITAISEELWYMNYAYKTVLDMIDLAIEETCEWKEISWNVYNAHERFCRDSILKEWKFCPYCGKPIKISEVE